MKTRFPALLAVACLGLSACSGDASGGSGGSGDTEGDAEAYPNGPITVTAGADPGSGFDTTLRALVQVLQEEELVDVPLPVENRPGGASAVWTQQLIERHAGADDQISIASLVTMTNFHQGQSEYNYDDLTMIARLITEYFLIVTSPDSGYADIEAVLEAIAQDPGSVPVGGAPEDQLAFTLLVEAAGGDPSELNYVAYDGGGQQSNALLSGDIAVAIAGTSEFLPLVESGDLTALTVIGDEPLDGLPDVPTTVEQGYDVTLSNWRGIVGPPDMPEEAVNYWQDVLAEAVETETWQDTAANNQWVTTFMVGDEMNDYLAEIDQQVARAIETTNSR